MPFEGLGVCEDNDSQRSYTRHFRCLDPFAEESKPAERRIKNGKSPPSQTLLVHKPVALVCLKPPGWNAGRAA